MSDVDTWSPVDESNTSPPPDGFPEFMLPSGVNNSARAMMGAVRRMYDKQVDGTTVLPYLKLSGGTVTGATTFAGITATTLNTSGGGSIGGTLTVTGAVNTGSSINCVSYSLSGQNFATRGSNDTHLYDSSGQAAVLIRNPGEIWHFATLHRFTSRDLAATFVDINSSAMTVSVPITAGAITAGAITASADISVTGQVVAQGALRSNRADGLAFYAPNGGGTFGGTVSAGGFSTGGTVSGGTVASTGNINAAGSYTGGAFTGSSVNVGGEVRGGSLATGGNASISGNLTVSGNANVGNTVTVLHIVPNADNTGICGGSAAAWQVVESYAFINLSDAALKQDLGSLPDTLPLVAAIEPQAFRYGDDPIRHWGFVAQDVRTALGDLPVDIVRGEEGRLGLDYAGLTAMLWRAVQSLAAKVQQLEGSHV
jgi:hypothetical protein